MLGILTTLFLAVMLGVLAVLTVGIIKLALIGAAFGIVAYVAYRIFQELKGEQ